MKLIINIIGAIKLFLAYIYLKIFNSNLYRQHIWLVCEKPTEARDNGYHFFKYVRENNPTTNIYYVIEKGSSDIKKIDKYDNIIYYNSFKHCIYFLAAEKCISSQALPFPYSYRLSEGLWFLRNKKLKTIWLQHGVTKDKLDHKNMNYKIKKYNLLACCAQKECNFIKKEYDYPDNVAVNIGFCRYDNLYNLKNCAQKRILVMPTFRTWLSSKDCSKEATDNEKSRFKQSEFYNKYIELLCSEKLNEILNNYGYKLIFYPHYALQGYIGVFQEAIDNENVIIADRENYDVQDLLISSSILITDFSSVFFDFAYMKKPVIFYQFDENKYRDSHYKEGYFSYKSHGFGPVTSEIEDLLHKLRSIVENKGLMDKKYIDRVEGFFTYTDNNNCLRTYNAINNL